MSYSSYELPTCDLHDGVTVNSRGSYKSTEDGYTVETATEIYNDAIDNCIFSLEDSDDELMRDFHIERLKKLKL